MSTPNDFTDHAAQPGVPSSSPADGESRPCISATGPQRPRDGDAPKTAGEAHPLPGPKRSAEPYKRKQSAMFIVVVAIPVDAYPAFARDREHPFALMNTTDRIEATVRFCGRLWADTLKRAAKEADTNSRNAIAA
jgi:hypothetical protein